MSLFGSLFGKDKKRNIYKDLVLKDLIEKRNNLKEGIFANINNDLNESLQKLEIKLDSNSSYDEKLFHMSYAYARRTAAAALVLQGVFSIKNFQHAQKVFQATQTNTIHTKEFQELASFYGHQYILSYDNNLTLDILGKILLPVLQNHSDDVKTAKDLGLYFTYEELLNNIPI